MENKEQMDREMHADISEVDFEEQAISNGLVEDGSEMGFELKGNRWQTLPINEPQKGILIVGAAGSGKTKSVVEPILFKMIQQGYAGILYDFAFNSEMGKRNFSLTHLVYHCLENFTKEEAPKFFSINFQDLKTSARFNPIAPESIKDKEDIRPAIETLMLNLNPAIVIEADEFDRFLHDNTVSLLTSIILFLYNQHPAHCSLPHAIMMGLEDSETLLAALSSDMDSKEEASSIIDAFKKGDVQFLTFMSSFKISLMRFLNKKIFWVLSGKDPLPIVNDPENPSIISLGNTATDSKTFSPILAMLASMMISKMYKRGRNKSFIMLDELPTIFIPNLSKVVAIASQYRISLIAALKSFAQLEKYGHNEAKDLRSTFSNSFFGSLALEDAEYLTKLMGKEVVEEASLTESGEKESKTTHQREQSIIRPQEVMSFKSGEFIGKVVHEDGGFSHMKLSPLESYNWKLKFKQFKPLPLVSENADVDANFIKIQEDVERIASLYRKPEKHREEENGKKSMKRAYNNGNF